MKDLVLGWIERAAGGYWLTEMQWEKIKRWLKRAGINMTEEKAKRKPKNQ